MNSIRVLLADDHNLVRAGLRALLDGMPNIAVVAEARDGVEAIRLVEQTNPSIALLDIAMPGLSGLAACRSIHERFPRTRVVLLTMYDSHEYVSEALRAGAAGYLIKDSAVGELESAIAAVAAGGIYLSPRISRQLAQAVVTGAQGPGEAGLTARQSEVLSLVAGGCSSKEIARQLGLSVKTIETHRTQIMDRLGIRDVAGLVRYAIRTGLVSSDE